MHSATVLTSGKEVCLEDLRLRSMIHHRKSSATAFKLLAMLRPKAMLSAILIASNPDFIPGLITRSLNSQRER